MARQAFKNEAREARRGLAGIGMACSGEACFGELRIGKARIIINKGEITWKKSLSLKLQVYHPF
jgi:hypothetical protein